MSSEEPFDRMLVEPAQRPAWAQGEGAPDTHFLDYLEVHRDTLIMELHAIDDLLLKTGRLKRRTIPRRVK